MKITSVTILILALGVAGGPLTSGFHSHLAPCASVSNARQCKTRPTCAWDKTNRECRDDCKKVRTFGACTAIPHCVFEHKMKAKKLLKLFPTAIPNAFKRGKCVFKPAPPANDADEDGLTDDIDVCPEEAGDILDEGCPCDPTDEDLLDYPQWQEEDGYWFGEYTFLQSSGDPKDSTTWPYNYAHYYGFIHMEIEGNALRQRNVFVYPPQTAAWCAANGSPVLGDGACGNSGNEKIFSADQTASDCHGNLAGTYGSGAQMAETTTTLVGDDAILYRVALPEYPSGSGYEAFSGALMQSQLTTLPGNGSRVRTAQGFNPFAGGASSYASYYREYRLDSKEEWLAKLAEVRALANVSTADECGYDGATGAAVPEPASGTSRCEEHFGFTMSLSEDAEYEYEAVE